MMDGEKKRRGGMSISKNGPRSKKDGWGERI